MSAAFRPYIVALHAILVGAVLLTGTVIAESRGVTLRLQNDGRRAGRQSLGAVRVVDASQGAVVIAEPVGKRGVAKLVLPAGIDFALGTVVRQNGARTGVSRVFLVGRKQLKPVTIPLTSTVAAGRTARMFAADMGPTSALHPAAVVASVAAGDGRTTITMGDVPLSGPGISNGSLGFGDLLLTALFNQTSDIYRWVDTSSEFLGARARELDLINQGKVDPASIQITGDPLTPDLRVDGTLTTDGTTVSGEIRIVDAATGEVLVRFPVDGQLDDLQDLRTRVADELARRLRERMTTTTSSSSTSTTTTSATVTTQPAATTTTTAVGTTSTTLPGTCTSVSSLYSCDCPGGGQFFGVRPCTSDYDCLDLGVRCEDPFQIHPRVTIQIVGPAPASVSWGSPVGVLAELSATLFYSLTACHGYDFPSTSACPLYFDAGTVLQLSTAQIISGVYPGGPGNTPYCGVQFVAWSGAVQCAGRGDSVQANGDCTNGTCTCTATVGAQDSEITATFALCDADAQNRLGCWVPPGCIMPPAS
jgi:hypothetical protein